MPTPTPKRVIQHRPHDGHQPHSVQEAALPRAMKAVYRRAQKAGHTTYCSVGAAADLTGLTVPAIMRVVVSRKVRSIKRQGQLYVILEDLDSLVSEGGQE